MIHKNKQDNNTNKIQKLIIKFAFFRYKNKNKKKNDRRKTKGEKNK